MIQKFGDRSCLAFEVGDADEPTGKLRRVDIWGAGRRLTYYDNSAFVPQFLFDLEHAIRWLRSDPDLSLPFPGLSPVDAHKRLHAVDDGRRESHWFFHWGPTTDDFLSLIFRSVGYAHLTFEFCRATCPVPAPGEIGEVFAVTLPERDLLAILEQTATALKLVPDA